MSKPILIMPFIDQSKSFTAGFECGLIYNQLENGECLYDHLIHRINVEQIKLICELFGAPMEVTDIDHCWCSLTIKSYL